MHFTDKIISFTELMWKEGLILISLNKTINMKKTILFGAFAMALVSCGESVDPAALSKEVCECYEKANGLPADAENREDEQLKCRELSTTNWEKVKGNKENEKIYNDAFPCGI